MVVLRTSFLGILSCRGHGEFAPELPKNTDFSQHSADLLEGGMADVRYILRDKILRSHAEVLWMFVPGMSHLIRAFCSATISTYIVLLPYNTFIQHHFTRRSPARSHGSTQKCPSTPPRFSAAHRHICHESHQYRPDQDSCIAEHESVCQPRC